MVTTDSPPAVSFKIVPVESVVGAPPDTATYAATYGEGDESPLFLLEFDVKSVKETKAGNLVFLFYEGRFRHVAGSVPAPFLAKLAKALGAENPKMSPTQADVLPFELGILGAHLSRDPMGGFSSKPRGDWVASKLFFADGAAEVYFAFQLGAGEAEFSPKDESYGDTILKELSKVLW